MAQASSSWQQLINQVPNWVFPDLKMGATKQHNLQKYKEPGILLGLLTIIIAMLLWDWKLLMASAVGIGMMILIYSMYQWNWHKNWYEIRQFFRSPHSRLTIAVASGGIACVTTYMAASVWVDSSSHWIAAGAILQAMGTLVTVILLIWQLIQFYGIREENYIDKLLYNLTAREPLKRLLAVRQLTKLYLRQGLEAEVQQNIIDCLRLLLSQEEETVIHQAILEALQTLETSHVLSSSKLKMIKVRNKVKQSIY
ncbi:armadillo-type fold-containing protein [Calothrix rhizosoleniae]|uniref:armadillo-type fold-containing protein n=1 Tax=Calothrix rhizosoleniae TaxID=888997 RepID=UPI000B4A10AD|nr:armadillo-type fold-containing protein [Calothrix rhizosoleniae]